MSLLSRRRGAPMTTEGVSSSSEEQGKGQVGPFFKRTRSILPSELFRPARIRWKEILLTLVLISYASYYYWLHYVYDDIAEPGTFPGPPPPHCQILYGIGIEGSKHHGVDQLLQILARQQRDASGRRCQVHVRSPVFRSVVRWYPSSDARSEEQHALDRNAVMEQLCPRDRGCNVILEDKSFPSGRGHRKGWQKLSQPSQVAESLEKHPHPLDLHKFVRDFEPHADVRFLVLHRPFVASAVSHWHFSKESQLGQNGALHGCLLFLAQVLRDTLAPWKVLCISQLDGADDENQRAKILAGLTRFLQWPQPHCPYCFSHWYASRKNPASIVGQETYEALLKERDEIATFWPPTSQRNITKNDALDDNYVCEP